MRSASYLPSEEDELEEIWRRAATEIDFLARAKRFEPETEIDCFRWREIDLWQESENDFWQESEIGCRPEIYSPRENCCRQKSDLIATPISALSEIFLGFARMMMKRMKMNEIGLVRRTDFRFVWATAKEIRRQRVRNAARIWFRRRIRFFYREN